MKITDTAECVNRTRLREEVFPRYIGPFSKEEFELAVGTFLFHAKGDEFYLRETEGEMHIFASHSGDISIELVLGEAWIDIVSYISPLSELEEDDLIPEEELEEGDDDPWIDPSLYLTSSN